MQTFISHSTRFAGVYFAFIIGAAFVGLWISKALNFSVEFSTQVEDPGLEPMVAEMQTLELLDIGELSSSITTLTAAPNSSLIWISSFLMFLAMLAVSFFSFKRVAGVGRLVLGWTIASIISCVHILAVDDLVDEAYVWAEKARQALISGVPGVPLWDGTYGESTVGYLQFVSAGLIHGLSGVGYEVALLLPVLAAAFIASWVIFDGFAREGRPLLGLIVTTVAGLNLPLVDAVSNGFDNVLVYSLLVVWVSLVMNTNLEPKRLIYLSALLAVIAPMLRLEYGVFSILVWLGILIRVHGPHENNSIGRGPLARAFWRATIYATLSISAFVLVKLWQFGSLLPAMASFKSFNGDVFSLLTGFVRTFVLPWNGWFNFLGWEPFSLMFSLGLVGAALLLVRQIGDNQRLLLTVLLPMLLLSTASALGSGGDYFSPEAMRYLFPIALAVFVVLAHDVPKRFDLRGWDTTARLTCATLVLLAIPIQANSFVWVRDVMQVSIGRSTCDAVAIEAFVQNGLLQEGDTLATTEVNGAAFHSRAKLWDAIGLVDARRYPLESVYPGTRSSQWAPAQFTHFGKFRLIPSKNDLQNIDFVWIWPSANCAGVNWDPGSRPLSTSQDAATEVQSLLGRPDVQYRVGLMSDYRRSGFRAILSPFSFTHGGEKRLGYAVALVKPSGDR